MKTLTGKFIFLFLTAGSFVYAQQPTQTSKIGLFAATSLSSGQNFELDMTQRKDITEVKSAAQSEIPLQGCPAPHVIDDGALFSYAPDLYQIGRRGAWYVDRILNGAKPQNLPVEGPREYEFVVNLKTARTISVQIPPEVLQRAVRVIE